VQAWSKPLPPAAEVEGVTIVFHDITDVQRDQRALRKTLLEQQAILENAAVGILFSKDGVILECNIRCAEMLGYSRDELEGASSVMVYPSEADFIKLGRRPGRCCRAGQSYTTEIQVRRKDGSLFWARLLAAPSIRCTPPTAPCGSWRTSTSTGWTRKTAPHAAGAEGDSRQRLGRHPVHQGAGDVEL
jgi:PAS domain S-box-containing protein